MRPAPQNLMASIRASPFTKILLTYYCWENKMEPPILKCIYYKHYKLMHNKLQGVLHERKNKHCVNNSTTQPYACTTNSTIQPLESKTPKMSLSPRRNVTDIWTDDRLHNLVIIYMSGLRCCWMHELMT